ncbi:MAG TPA: thiamine pyrophosphate-dependent enzyme [Capsulimonadaceae bacterium]|jgi:2-oxoisovalerate dehydrogenase E1 component
MSEYLSPNRPSPSLRSVSDAFTGDRDHEASSIETKYTPFEQVAVDLLHTMILSREADKREGVLLRQGKGWLNVPSAGHEAIAALCYHLDERDYLLPIFRDRALMLARGMSLDEMALDYYAREGSSSRGRNMCSHPSSRRLNVFTTATPVGAQCLPAVGIAEGLKRSASGGVVLCVIGDAATRQGEFFEAVNQAVQDYLPIIFLVEDNGYGISTPTEHTTPLALGLLPPKLLTVIEGYDAKRVYDVGAELIAAARAGSGPSILWCKVERLGNHTNADDHRVYRAISELETISERDPIALLSSWIFSHELADASVVEQERLAGAKLVKEAYAAAERAPISSDALSGLYGPAADAVMVPAAVRERSGAATTTMVRTINRVLRCGMESFDNMLLFGEDIEDPKGGVFGLTRGLSTTYPGRVTNSPLAEATILGAAVGLAATGYLPVFELQFIDFVGPGFNQIASHIVSLRWRTKGEWTCPMVIYAPYGAYLPGGGMWHSQSNEGLFTHMPGLMVAVPSTPEDAAGLFWSAFHGSDPTLILLPKHLFHVVHDSANITWEPVPLGVARVVREGADATVVAWGNCVELAEQAAETIAAEDGGAVEVIDLRSLVPCDWAAIEASVAKTGRLIVVQEDSRTGGFGQSIISEMVSHEGRFFSLAAPPYLVSRPDVHVPFHPDLELATLPSASDIVAAIRKTRA